MKPLAIDLFCGLGGWTAGLLAEGYGCIGFDIERHVYGEHRYPAQLVIQDVLTLHGSQFRDATLIVASPPCQEFSYMAMPWSRAKAKVAAIRADETGQMQADLTRLFDACFRIQREACEAAGRHIPLVVENVRGANEWVGRSRWSFGSFHLWGDVPALMPSTIGRPIMKEGIAHRSNGATNFHGNANGQKGDGSGWRENGTLKSNNRMVPDGIKNPGMNWAGYGDPNYKSVGFNVVNAQRFRQDEGLKVGGSWFGVGNDCSPMRPGSSRSDSRKAASAMIAKIPETLARHVAATFRP